MSTGLIVGSNAGAVEIDVETCGDRAGDSNRGVWFSITGTGKELTVLVVGTVSYFTPDFSSVYSGDCGDLQCIASFEYCTYNNIPCHVVPSWHSVFGETYFVLVHFYREGRFNLTVDEV